MKILLMCSMLLAGHIFSADNVYTWSSQRFSMPSESVLKERLQKDFGHFVQETDIVSSLAGKKKLAMGVVFAVDASIHDYSIKNQKLGEMIYDSRPSLFKLILSDHPEAIQELKKNKMM